MTTNIIQQCVGCTPLVPQDTFILTVTLEVVAESREDAFNKAVYYTSTKDMSCTSIQLVDEFIEDDFIPSNTKG